MIRVQNPFNIVTKLRFIEFHLGCLQQDIVGTLYGLFLRHCLVIVLHFILANEPRKGIIIMCPLLLCFSS